MPSHQWDGSVLDYMQIAGLLKTHNGRDFYVNSASNGIILKYLSSNDRFEGYDDLYTKSNVIASDVESRQQEWEDYANQEMPDKYFSIDISQLLGAESSAAKTLEQVSELYKSLEQSQGQWKSEMTTGDIGERGEALVYGHECMRLKNDGREDLIHLVKRIPTSFALGFDISSVESDTEQKRYIEVKSTASFKPILFNSVHLTPNEWRVAETERGRYYVYRLFLCISTGEAKLYMLQDPVGKYKTDKITMMPSSAGGVDVRFDSKKVGQFEELLKWNG